MHNWILLLLLATASIGATAGEVRIVDASAQATGAGMYRISVTLEHADSGWDHYADRWEVASPDGTLLGTRILYHPHVNEQPFTRSLGGISIPDSTTQVLIRARDKLHGYTTTPFPLELPR